MTDGTISIKTFDELTVDELYEILKLRVDVFVVEQKCPYAELDGRDRQALHVFLRDGGGIQAYLRVMDAGVCGPHVALGRVVARQRRRGLGTRILQEGIRAARAHFGGGPIQLEAQVYARAFYERQGFRAVSDPFDEDGIPHIRMLLEGENP